MSLQTEIIQFTDFIFQFFQGYDEFRLNMSCTLVKTKHKPRSDLFHKWIAQW